MHTFLFVLGLLLQVFWFLLLARIIIEMIVSFSRDWRPRGVFAVLCEALFTVTDPPVKLMRRIIPPVRIGSVSLDLSVAVLFIVIVVLQNVLGFVASTV